MVFAPKKEHKNTPDRVRTRRGPKMNGAKSSHARFTWNIYSNTVLSIVYTPTACNYHHSSGQSVEVVVQSSAAAGVDVLLFYCVSLNGPALGRGVWARRSRRKREKNNCQLPV